MGVPGHEESWSLLYNAYADRLLGTNLLTQSVRNLVLESHLRTFSRVIIQLLESQIEYYASLLNSCTLAYDVEYTHH